VSAHIESTETEPEEQEDEDMVIADDQEEETPDEEEGEGEGEGDVVEGTVMDVVPPPDVQQHIPRKMQKEKIVRVMPRLYKHVRAQLLQPPKSFLMDEDEDEEEDEEEEEEDEEDEEGEEGEEDEEGENPPSQAEQDDEDGDADVEAPKKRRAIASNSGPFVRSRSIGNGIRPALVWSKKGARPTHILFV
jgi:hypothetical protein